MPNNDVSQRRLYLTVPYMRGPDVLAVQERLAQLGYDPGPLDGIYGPQTEAAVRAFQSDHGLTVDGIVGPQTYRALGIALPPQPPPGGNLPGRPEPGTQVRTLINIPNSENMVALTFDDGPNPPTTESLLRALKDKGVHATWFVLGRRVQAHPGLAREIASGGHQLAVHSYDHVSLTGLSDAQIASQLDRTRDLISSVTGLPPTTYFRPPNGEFDNRVLRVAGEEGFRWNVFWDVSSRDEKSPGIWTIVNETVRQTKNGSIILLHDLNAQTVSALPMIIDRLRSNGFTFGTVEELVRAGSTGTAGGGTGQPPGQPGPPAGSRNLYLTTPYMRGEDVRLVQEKLIELGYDPGPLDSVYGPRTSEAVRKFQADEGLPPTGVVDRETFRRLGLIL